MSQRDLIKKVIIVGGKSLSARGENDTTSNEDIATTPSMSVRVEDTERELENERERERAKRKKGPKDDQVALIWSHGEMRRCRRAKEMPSAMSELQALASREARVVRK